MIYSYLNVQITIFVFIFQKSVTLAEVEINQLPISMNYSHTSQTFAMIVIL